MPRPGIVDPRCVACSHNRGPPASLPNSARTLSNSLCRKYRRQRLARALSVQIYDMYVVYVGPIYSVGNIVALTYENFNPLMPNRYNCTFVLCLFLRSNCCKKSTLTLLTHKSPKRIIVSIEINHFSKVKVKLAEI